MLLIIANIVFLLTYFLTCNLKLAVHAIKGRVFKATFVQIWRWTEWEAAHVKIVYVCKTGKLEMINNGEMNVSIETTLLFDI